MEIIAENVRETKFFERIEFAKKHEDEEKTTDEEERVHSEDCTEE